VITDVDSYHILVIPEEGCRLEISNGDAHAVVEEGGGARLTPQHHVPIRAVVKASANHSIQPTGASRSGQREPVHQWRLAPAADAERWAARII
jgi:hypothetical protein